MPWVVWYETGNTDDGPAACTHNELVFAAKGVTDAAADGGFHWVAVGSQLSARWTPLAPTLRRLRRVDTDEAACSLNNNADRRRRGPAGGRRAR